MLGSNIHMPFKIEFSEKWILNIQYLLWGLDESEVNYGQTDEWLEIKES